MVTWTLTSILQVLKQHLDVWVTAHPPLFPRHSLTTLLNKREATIPLSTGSFILHITYLPFHSPTPFWTAPISYCREKAREWLSRVHFRGHDYTHLASICPKQSSDNIPTLKPPHRPSQHPLRKAINNLSPPWQLWHSPHVILDTFNQNKTWNE